VLISNVEIDEDTAMEIDKLFFEVLIAPSFAEKALDIFKKKKNRILLELKYWPGEKIQFKNLLNGIIQQSRDNHAVVKSELKSVTSAKSTASQLDDLVYAIRIVKHLKSNAIAIVNDKQLVGMGCGQTSRVDALNQAISKSKQFGFGDKLDTSSLASEAFFPFPDCVEISKNAGIKSVAQPGGSVKDKESIDFCELQDVAMYLTGIRHFKH
ncbi:MAG: bifunctional phosphoribosylaminoimidazolecarboxamide formyltransferase/IMP cyclohydrolase PurH, partial [Saprospiraceae bacterium]